LPREETFISFCYFIAKENNQEHLIFTHQEHIESNC
jgi:hypothetical protein